MHGAMRQHGTEFESEIGGSPQLLDRRGEYLRHILTAELRWCPELGPAAGHELLVRVAKPGCRDYALLRPARTLLVARLVERVEHILREACRFFEHGSGELVRVFREIRACPQLRRSEQLIEHETQFPQWRAIHGKSPRSPCGLVYRVILLASRISTAARPARKGGSSSG